MTVLNKHHGNIPADAIYIGRGSKWGNPYPIDATNSRDSVIELYECWLDQQIKIGKITVNDLANLHGKDLVCYCVPARCHGHILEQRAIKAHKRVNSKPKFNLIVAGGRKFTDYTQLTLEINNLVDYELTNHMVSIVSGMAPGVDIMAWEFCKEFQVNCIEMPADWEDVTINGAVVKYHDNGRPYNVVAGHQRNARMAKIGDGLLAMWDGRSTGTGDMIDRMNKLNKPVRIINY